MRCVCRCTSTHTDRTLYISRSWTQASGFSASLDDKACHCFKTRYCWMYSWMANSGFTGSLSLKLVKSAAQLGVAWNRNEIVNVGGLGSRSTRAFYRVGIHRVQKAKAISYNVPSPFIHIVKPNTTHNVPHIIVIVSIPHVREFDTRYDDWRK